MIHCQSATIGEIFASREKVVISIKVTGEKKKK